MSAQETFSVGMVQEFCALTDHLDECDISFNDKVPCWDGHILYYKGKKPTITGSEYRIPVQIKGQQAPTDDSTSISFSIETKHLQNYFSDGGILYIVVRFCKTPLIKKMYAKVLLPLDLKRIMRGKSAQKTISVRLDHIDSPDRLVRMCDFFVQNKPKQAMLLYANTSEAPTAFRELSVSMLGASTRNDFLSNMINCEEKYMYGVLNGAYFPIDVSYMIASKDSTHHIACSDAFSERVSSRVVYETGQTSIILLDAIVFRFNHIKNNLTLKITSGKDHFTYDKVYQIARLVIAFQNTRSISINGISIFSDFPPGLDRLFSEDAVGFFQMLRDIGSICQGLGIDMRQITRQAALSEAFIGSIKKTQNRLLNKTHIPLTTAEPYVVFHQDVGSYIIRLLATKCDDGLYELSDFFTARHSIGVFVPGTDGQNIQISNWLGAAPEEFPRLLLNRVEMVADLHTGITDVESEILTLYVLSLIDYYDLYGNKNDLLFALELNELSSASPSQSINRIQIRKRLNICSEDDNTELGKIKTDCPGLPACCACILLDQIDDFSNLYEGLTDREKESLQNWPIFTLLTKKDALLTKRLIKEIQF